MTINHVTYACTVHGVRHENMNIITEAVETREVSPWNSHFSEPERSSARTEILRIS
jgi:hypothetical protein